MIDAIKRSTGTQPRGWLSPAPIETHRSLDLLAAAGIQYVANWVNDEQPHPMRADWYSKNYLRNEMAVDFFKGKQAHDL